jgi:prohibitin 2
MKNFTVVLLGVSLFFLLLIILIFSPFAMVDAGHRGVVVQFGEVQDHILSEGFHFISPLENVEEYDVRTQKVETDADAASGDLQSVNTTIAVNFHVNPDLVKSLFQETQGDYQVTLINPAIQEAVKEATAQFTADQLITKRQEVKEAMRSALTSREAMKFFVVEDVSIVNFSFSASFNQAIEKKVQAEQDALAAKNKLEQVKYEAEQKVVAAEAEAESIRIQAQAVTSQGGADYVKLQWIAQWNGVMPSYVMGDAMPLINIGN